MKADTKHKISECFWKNYALIYLGIFYFQRSFSEEKPFAMAMIVVISMTIFLIFALKAIKIDQCRKIEFVKWVAAIKDYPSNFAKASIFGVALMFLAKILGFQLDTSILFGALYITFELYNVREILKLKQSD